MNEPDDYRQRQRINLIVLGIVVAIIAATVALLLALHQGIKREDCFAANHRSCAPISEQQ